MKTKYLFFITILISFFLSYKGLGQSFFTHHPQYHFQNFKIENTSSHSNFLYDIYQDEKGFLWMGTLNGLYRYDGYQFKSYYSNPNDPKAISGNTPNRILGDPAGGFWVSTRSSGLLLSGEGMDYYNPNDNTFENYRFDTIQLNSQENIINDFFWEKEQSYFWVGTNDGLFQFFPKKHKHNKFNIGETLKSNTIRCIAKQPQGKLFVGTNNGLFVVEENTNTSLIQELSDYRIIRLLFISEEELLIGTTRGLFRYHLTNNKLQPISFQIETKDQIDKKLANRYVNNIKALLKDSTGNIWIGSQMGLFQLDWNTNTTITYNSEIQENGTYLVNRVNSILQDREGTIWLGKSNGISQVFSLEKKIEKYELVNPNILAIAEKNNPRFFNLDGSIRNTSCAIKTLFSNHSDYDWVGTSMGLYQFDTQKKVYFQDHPIFDRIPTIKTKNITSFFIDSGGDYWIGLNNFTTHAPEQLERTLYYFQKESNQVKTFSENAPIYTLPKGAIKSVVEDKDGNIWIACPQGLAKYIRDKDEVVHYKNTPNLPNSISSNYIRLVFKDQLNQIWVGTSDNGLNLYHPERDDFQHFSSHPSDSNSLSNKRINTLYHASDGWIWIGTELGLNKIHPTTKVIKRVDFQNNDQRIKSIVEGEKGKLWIGAYSNLYEYDLDTKNAHQFVSKDGLNNDLLINNTSLKNKQGDLLIGCSSGLYYAPKEAVFMDTLLPPIEYTNLLVQRKQVVDTCLLRDFYLNHQLTLLPNQNTVEIQFSILDYSPAARKRFRYKLKGYLDDWQNIGSNNKIELLNLPYGKYQLQVEGSHTNDIYTARAIPLSIDITPPWYRSLWAKLLYGIAALLTLIAVYYLQLNRQLRIASNKRLVELNQLKNKLYADITHEFRSPLTVIQGMVQQIKDRQYKQATDLIYQNSQHLLSLVNKILDLSKLESGNMTLNLQQNNIIPLINYIISSFQPVAEKKGINLKLNSSLSELVMDVDVEKFQTILSNLLTNAIKYSEPNENIEVAIEKVHEQDAPSLKLAVRDNGSGIPEEDIPRIFDRYYQANTDAKRKGTGIGLALTKELVQLFHGTIEVNSTFSKGTVFTILLPITNQESIGEGVINYPNASAAPITEVVPFQSHEEEESKPTVLIVEDHADVFYYLSTILKDQYSIVHSENGVLGIKKAKEIIPDIIISDIMMPELDGFGVCKALKKATPTNHIPIILLTAKANMEDKLKGLQLGADAYLYKPFHQRELLIQIEQLIQQRRNLQAVFSKQLTSLQPSPAHLENSFLNQVNQIIRKNIKEEDISNLLFKELTMSRSQFYRKIKALTDLSTTNYIKKIRIKRAYSLLTETTESISEIAYLVGFKDPAHFSRTFKNEYGVSPRSFRSTLSS